ncbi:C2 domain-containing family protein [Hibiscus syriacus]|uniref:C2 domain-containing family protein n=1 Tax=Hibiscus syriacus TaxID=106335 RepID=A0A6A2WL77_HIBSY|nr:C2 domain-containing family protein [Hibiscus syriacus]
MADYSGAISLSQPHISDEDTSEHSPRSIPASPCGGGGFSSKSKTPSSSENTARKPRGYEARDDKGVRFKYSIRFGHGDVRGRSGVCISLMDPLLGLSGSFIASTTLSSSNETPRSSSSSSYSTPSSLSSNLSCYFGVTLAGAQGQVFGGIIGGKVMAATQVIVVATTFVSSAFHRLPCESGNDVEGGGAVGATESCSSTGMSMAVYGVAA